MSTPYSFPPNPSQSQIYLRFKRHHHTVFVPCESIMTLQTVKERLAELMGKDEDDVRLFEHLETEKRQQMIHQIIEKQKEALKLSKKKSSSYVPLGQELKVDTPETVQIPPLDCTKKLWELGLDNDHIVFFVYRTSEFDDEWESINVPGVFVDQRSQASANNVQELTQPSATTVPPTPSNQTA
jgi:hypothetical protein